MILFKIAFAIDAIISVVACYFFFIGLGDGSVSSYNIGLWLLVLAALGIILFGSIWLNNHQHPALALALVCVLAIPAFFYLIYMMIALFGGGRWN